MRTRTVRKITKVSNILNNIEKTLLPVWFFFLRIILFILLVKIGTKDLPNYHLSLMELLNNSISWIFDQTEAYPFELISGILLLFGLLARITACILFISCLLGNLAYDGIPYTWFFLLATSLLSLKGAGIISLDHILNEIFITKHKKNPKIFK